MTLRLLKFLVDLEIEFEKFPEEEQRYIVESLYRDFIQLHPIKENGEDHSLDW